MWRSAASSSPRQATYFSIEIIDANLSEYSSHCWRERERELRTIYTPAEIKVIKGCLWGWETRFGATGLQERLKRRAAEDQFTRQFLNTTTVDLGRIKAILRNLYLIGILGQTRGGRENRSEERWVYRGNFNCELESTFLVHRALWHELAVGPISADCFTLGQHFHSRQLSASSTQW